MLLFLFHSNSKELLKALSPFISPTSAKNKGNALMNSIYTRDPIEIICYSNAKEAKFRMHERSFGISFSVGLLSSLILLINKFKI